MLRADWMLAPTALASPLLIGSWLDVCYSRPRVSESRSGNRLLPYDGMNCMQLAKVNFE